MNIKWVISYFLCLTVFKVKSQRSQNQESSIESNIKHKFSEGNILNIWSQVCTMRAKMMLT